MSLPELPNGTKVFIGTLGAAVGLSAIENGVDPDATLASIAGLAAGSILLISNGWDSTDKRLLKIGTPGSGVVPLLGIDTTDTVLNAPASAVGTVRPVSAWTEIIDLSDWSVSNGQQNYRDRRPLAALQGIKLPTFRDGDTGGFKILNDTNSAHYRAIKAAHPAAGPAPLKLLMPSGKERFAMAYFSISAFESITQDMEMTFDVALSFLTEPTRYQP